APSQTRSVPRSAADRRPRPRPKSRTSHRPPARSRPPLRPHNGREMPVEIPSRTPPPPDRSPEVPPILPQLPASAHHPITRQPVVQRDSPRRRPQALGPYCATFTTNGSRHGLLVDACTLQHIAEAVGYRTIAGSGRDPLGGKRSGRLGSG